MSRARQSLSILERRDAVGRMLRLEYTVDEIVERLGVRKTTVYSDIKWIRDFEKKKILINRHDVVAETAANLDMIRREAVLAWRRSQEDAVEVTTETVDDEETGEKVVVKQQEKRKGQVGAPAYLETAKDAVWKKATLFGAVSKDGQAGEGEGEGAGEVVWVEVDSKEEGQESFKMGDMRVVLVEQKHGSGTDQVQVEAGNQPVEQAASVHGKPSVAARIRRRPGKRKNKSRRDGDAK